MVGNFPKDFSQVAIFPNVQFPNRKIPKSIIAAPPAPPPYCNRGRLRGPNLTFRKLALGKLHIWEITTWKNSTLGSRPLENAFGKVHNTIFSILLSSFYPSSIIFLSSIYPYYILLLFSFYPPSILLLSSFYPPSILLLSSFYPPSILLLSSALIPVQGCVFRMV